jgi:hypothetical protein
MFTESAWDHYFRAFRDAPGKFNAGDWTFERTEEDSSLLARHRSELRLVLISGRQVVTRERLEVLALGTDHEFADGLGLEEAVQSVRHSGAIVVLPWGFGKWWSARGQRVRDFLSSMCSSELFLGDNGGRLALAPEPSMFAAARARGIRTLPGSDPLPFASQNATAGSYGFSTEEVTLEGRPAEALKAAIRAVKEPTRTFGRRESLLAFCRNQLAMQLRNRSGRAAS